MNNLSLLNAPVISEYITKQDISGFALTSQLSDYALCSDLSNYALCANYALCSDLSNYALCADYALRNELTNFLDLRTGGIVSGEFGAYRTEFKILSGNFKQSNYGIVENYSAKNSFLQAEEAWSDNDPNKSYGEAYTGTMGYCILSVNKNLKEIKLSGNIDAIEDLLNNEYDGKLPSQSRAIKILETGSHLNSYSYELSDIKFSLALGSNADCAAFKVVKVIENREDYGIISVDNIPDQLTAAANNLTSEEQYKSLFLSDDNAIYAIGFPKIGNQKIANFYAQHGEGGSVRAIGKYTHAEGRDTVADVRYSHVEGSHNIAGGMGSHAEGFYNYAYGRYSHAEGTSNRANGYQSHAEGLSTIANADRAHSEGMLTIAAAHQSHAEGNSTSALGNATHSEGIYTIASISASHVEGFGNVGGIGESKDYTGTQVGFAVHSEGINNKAIGVGSHVEGHNNDSPGNFSHAEGIGYRICPQSDILAFSFQANSKLLSVNNSTYPLQLHDVINYGTSYREITVINRTDGDEISSIELNSALSSGTAILDNVRLNVLSGGVALREAAHVEGKYNLAIGSHSHAEGAGNRAIGNQSHAEGYMTHSLSARTHTEGFQTSAFSRDSHAEGCNCVAGNSVKPSVSTDSMVGAFAHAEGNGTFAKGNSSHAEGKGTEALAPYSHAEGLNSIASGNRSHAEGQNSEASNDDAHAEGNSTKASGKQSHAEGSNTQATKTCSHAAGYYSLADKNYSWVWNGDNTITNYSSSLEGSFSINPKNGLNGFFVGAQSISAIVRNAVESILREHSLIQ